MKKLSWTLVLFTLLLGVMSALCSGQSQKDSDKPDLSKFSSDQLNACFRDAKICGSKNQGDISDELARRLPSFSTDQLIACFDDWDICGIGDSLATGWPVADELARREDPHKLLARYWKERKWSIREGIIRVAYNFDNPEVTAFMRRVVIEHAKKNEYLYWAANYLAKKCDPVGLKELGIRTNRDRPCLQYATTVELFGKCSYRPAIPYLVNTGVHDVCLNVVIAADHSLHALYPDGPKDFDKLDDMQRYFCGRAKHEGFRVHCKLK